MTDTYTGLIALDEWYAQLNQHEAQRRDIEFVATLMATLDRLGAMIRKSDLERRENHHIFTVHGSYPRGSLTTPVLGYEGEGVAFRLLMLKSNTWLVSVKITNGKPPAFPKLNKLVQAALPPKLVNAVDHRMPESWRFGSFEQNSSEFTAWLNHDHWVFAFINLLLDELEQTNS